MPDSMPVGTPDDRSVSFAFALLQVLGVHSGLQPLHRPAAGAALGLESKATYCRQLADRRELVLVRFRERAPARGARDHLICSVTTCSGPSRTRVSRTSCMAGGDLGRLLRKPRRPSLSQIVHHAPRTCPRHVCIMGVQKGSSWAGRQKYHFTAFFVGFIDLADEVPTAQPPLSQVAGGYKFGDPWFQNACAATAHGRLPGLPGDACEKPAVAGRDTRGQLWVDC